MNRELFSGASPIAARTHRLNARALVILPRTELVAFLLWYVFLVLCCVVPTCCAYRRRRLVEQRMTQQQENFARMQESNFFFLSNLTRTRDGESAQVERARVLTEILKNTTMVRL